MEEAKDFYHFEIGLGLFDLRKGSDLSSENISFLHLATSFTLFTSQNVPNLTNPSQYAFSKKIRLREVSSIKQAV